MRALAAVVATVLCVAGCDDGAARDAERDAGERDDSGASDASAPAIQRGLTIATAKGNLRGAQVGATRVFQGIPYAAPPVGALRWRAPVPAEAWDGTLDATAPGPMCPQFVPIVGNVDDRGDEDCLSLNVWTPEPAPKTPLSVMVWIHGGSFEIGSGAEPQYDGRLLSERGDVVVVTINYRLGPLGFLAHPALEADDPDGGAGNWGIRDQQLALRWVHDEIAAFGGDPGSVTVFGESAGAMSACVHLVAPESRDLAQRVIMESGVCVRGDGTRAPVQSAEQAHELGARFAKGVGCDADGDVAGCLRALSAEDALRWTENAADFLSEVRWRPVIDGKVIPDAPEAMIADGDWSGVPIVLGTNRDELALFVAPPLGMPIATRDAYVALVAAQYPGRADEVLAQYPADDDAAANDAFVRLMSDWIFTCPTRTLARAAADVGGATYLYSFEQVPSNSIFGDIGVFHAAEIPFVFGTSSPLGGADSAPALSEAMQNYWTAFAHAGDPNGGDLEAWPRYETASDKHMVLALPLVAGVGLRREACDFWDAFAAP